MANSAEQDPTAKHRYEEVEVFKVDIVGGPATKDKFLTLRSEDEGEVPRPRRSAMTKAAVEALRQSNEGIVSLPVVARQEVVEQLNTDTDLEPDSDEDNKTQQPVEREENEPENNSEETMKTKELEEKLGKVTGRLERMEQAVNSGDFSGVLGTAGATPEGEEEEPEVTPAPEGKTTPAPEPPADGVAPEVTPAPAPESVPAPAPVAAPVEPEAVASTPVPAPVETLQEAPVPAVPATDPAMVDAVGNLAGMVERMGAAFTTGLAEVNKKIDGTLGRVDKVERSVLSGGNSEEGDGTEGPIERGAEGEKPGLFHSVFHK